MNARAVIRRLLVPSLRRAVLLLPVCVLLPLLFAQAWVFVRWYDAQERYEVQTNLEVARAAAASFDAFLADVLRQELTLGNVLSRSASLELRREILAEAAEEYPSIRDILWLAPSGRVLLRAKGRGAGVDLSAEPYFRKILSGWDWAVGGLVRSGPEGRPAFVIARGIRNPQGVLQGIVAAVLDPARLGEVLALERPAEGTLLLLDGAGTVIYRYPEVDLPWDQRRSLAGVPELRQVPAGKEAVFSLLSPIDAKPRIYGAAPVGLTGWITAASRPAEAALGPLSKVLPRSAILLAGALALALTLAYGIGLLVRRPVQRLQEHALALGRGEFGRRAEDGGPEEFRLLAEAFNRMAAELEERERERRKAEQSLRENEERLRLSNEAADLGVWEWDVERGTLTWDARLRELLGFDAATEASYERLLDLLHLEDRVRVQEALEQSILDRSEYEAEYRIVRPNGDLRWILARGKTVEGSSGGPLRMLGVALDVTKRKEYEQAMARASEVLLLDRAKSEFMALASHELHTPLNSILGFTELLLDGVDGRLTPAQRKDLERIAASGRRLLLISDAILDLSRLKAGEEELRVADFCLRARLASGVEALKARAARKAIGFSWEVEPEVPDELRGDPERLLQVLAHLLENAIKYTERGGVKLSVARHLQLGDRECLRFTVEDTGAGIPSERQAFIFEAFAQVEAAATRAHEGLGIGLAICQTIVEKMGGRLWLESEPGRGSTFRFTAWFERAGAAEEGLPGLGCSS